jgi:hypothetical protein
VEDVTGAVERTFERMSRAGSQPDQAAELIETLVSVWSMAIYGAYTPPGARPPGSTQQTQ